MENRRCENCIWWGNLGLVEKKIVMTPNEELQVKKCLYRPHPNVIVNYKPLLTTYDFVCSAWQK